MGGSSPNSDLNFLGEILYFFVFFVLFFIFSNVSKKNNELDRGVGGCCPTNSSFSWIFFNLTRPLSRLIK